MFMQQQPYYFYDDQPRRIRRERYPTNMIKRNENDEYLCPKCGRNFIRLDSLRNHLYKDCQNTRFTCEICTKSFKRKYVLKQHLKTVHNHFFY